jgi:hypothetical protein
MLPAYSNQVGESSVRQRVCHSVQIFLANDSELLYDLRFTAAPFGKKARYIGAHPGKNPIV